MLKKSFIAVAALAASATAMAVDNPPFHSFEIPAALNSSGTPLKVMMVLTRNAEVFQATMGRTSQLTRCAKYAEHAIDTSAFIDEMVNKVAETTPASQKHDALYISELQMNMDMSAGLKKGVELCQKTSSPSPDNDYKVASKVLSAQADRLTQMLKTARSAPKP